METRLQKFVEDQEAAVAIAREASHMPLDYNIRVDALNAALALAVGGETTMRDVVRDARVVEKYLRGEVA